MRMLSRIFILSGLILFFLWALLIVRIYIDSNTDQRADVDAIVVMGASQWNGKPSPAFQARLDRAYDIFNEVETEYIILTGGIAAGETISESSVGRSYLQDRGIPHKSIIIEEEGKTTLQSLEQVGMIADEYRLDRLLFVSHGYHLHRVRTLARKNEIDNVLISSVQLEDRSNNLKLILRESFIHIAYLIKPIYKVSGMK